MRLFLTSYQKSGTHQIMPALRIFPDVVDRSGNDMVNLPEGYNVNRKIDEEGVSETCERLRNFDKAAFGHISYLPEYFSAVQAAPTKIIFNVRDPRDVVVSNYYNILKKHDKRYGHGHLNFKDLSDGKLLIEKDDPISELIKIESERWPFWLGWLDHSSLMVKVNRYEDMRQRKTEVLQEIVNWLQPYDLDLEIAIRKSHPNPNGKNFRKGLCGEWKKLFNDEQKELANDLFSTTLSRLGYEI